MLLGHGARDPAAGVGGDWRLPGNRLRGPGLLAPRPAARLARGLRRGRDLSRGFSRDDPRLPGPAHEVDAGHLRVLRPGDVARSASRTMPLVEKLDVLFPALSLPLSLVYFLFVIDANLIFAYLFTHAASADAGVRRHGHRAADPRARPGFAVVSSWDFFLDHAADLPRSGVVLRHRAGRTPRQSSSASSVRAA